MSAAPLYPDTRDLRMPPSLRTFLTALIDYAGLFPPARLPLADALAHYARYRRAEAAWMLGPFICPVGKLSDLDAHAALFAEAPPFRFALLGTGGPDADAFLTAFAADLEARTAFLERHAGRVSADVMEVRLPPSLLAPTADHGVFLAALAHSLGAANAGVDLFFEVPLADARLRATLPVVLAAFAAHNAASPHRVGLKLRCGGLTPDAVPAVEALAFALAACRDAGVHFKATAGLHHPVRHHDEGLGVPMHGFFNVFGAAVLAATHPLDIPVICSILRDERPHHFCFTEDAFVWQNYAATADAIRHVRTTFAISFGSCSFEEPRADLRSLGLF